MLSVGDDEVWGLLGGTWYVMHIGFQGYVGGVCCIDEFIHALDGGSDLGEG